MLVALDEPARLRTFEVAHECLEAEVNVVVAVVNVTWGVVRDEDIDRGKRGHQVLNLGLLVKGMAAWLVAPRTE